MIGASAAIHSSDSSVTGLRDIDPVPTILPLLPDPKAPPDEPDRDGCVADPLPGFNHSGSSLNNCAVAVLVIAIKETAKTKIRLHATIARFGFMVWYIADTVEALV
jgi:hypothetical protein